MNRLPCYDRTTRRAERAVFASLGLAAIVTIALAVSDAARFISARDCIAAALSVKPAPALARKGPQHEANTTLTNATSNQTGRRPTAPVAPGKV